MPSPNEPHLKKKSTKKSPRKKMSLIQLKKSPENKEKKSKGKQKIIIEYIEDERNRLVTQSKRAKGLIKSGHELSVLTGAKVFILLEYKSSNQVVYATCDNHFQAVVSDGLVVGPKCKRTNEELNTIYSNGKYIKGFSYPTPSKSSSADLNICVPGEKNSPFLKKAANKVTSDIDDSLPLTAEGLVTSSPENNTSDIEVISPLNGRPTEKSDDDDEENVLVTFEFGVPVTSSPESNTTETNQPTSSRESNTTETSQPTSSPETNTTKTSQPTSSPESNTSKTSQSTSSPEINTAKTSQSTSSPESNTTETSQPSTSSKSIAMSTILQKITPESIKTNVRKRKTAPKVMTASKPAKKPKKTTIKCKVCDQTYFKKYDKKSAPKGRWIRCETDHDIWVHASCVDICDQDIDKPDTKWHCGTYSLIMERD